MPGGLAEQERDAKELFGRADRHVPDTNSIVRPFPLSPTYTYTYT